MKTGSQSTLDFSASLPFDDILTNPILDIAARFWDDERYEAFRITYRSMRRLDDLVDNRKATGQKLGSKEANRYRAMMYDWLESVKRREAHGQFQAEFLDVLERFEIPLTPWERLCQAMEYDLTYNSFDTFETFMSYAEGAAVAPASVFMHLCGLRGNSGSYQLPEYDIFDAARPLAVFSYLVHIMRDFQKDQRSHLNYFAGDILRKFAIDSSQLSQMAKAADTPSPPLRELFAHYKSEAESNRIKARAMINSIEDRIEPRYLLSLKIIYALYLQIHDRIDTDSGSFSTEALLPSPKEVKEMIERTVADFSGARK